MNLQERLLLICRRRFVGRLAYASLKVLGVEFPRSVQIGSGVELPHGAVGLVVHPSTVMGDSVKLYQGVTIGRSDTYKSPERTLPGGGVVVGDGVIIGAGAKILFRGGDVLTIGDHSVIGANSVLTVSVPPGEIWAGSPAVRISTRG